MPASGPVFVPVALVTFCFWAWENTHTLAVIKERMRHCHVSSSTQPRMRKSNMVAPGAGRMRAVPRQRLVTWLQGRGEGRWGRGAIKKVGSGKNTFTIPTCCVELDMFFSHIKRSPIIMSNGMKPNKWAWFLPWVLNQPVVLVDTIDS